MGIVTAAYFWWRTKLEPQSWNSANSGPPAFYRTRPNARSKAPFKPKEGLNGPPASVEDDGLPSIQQHAIVEMPAHGAGEHNLLQVASLLHQVMHGVAVRDARDLLFDDGAFVEHLGDV